MFTVGLGTESLLNLFLSIYYLHKYFSIILYYYIGLFFILLLVYLITMEVLDSGSFESYQSTCQPGTRTRVKCSDTQLSLECLPPEVPTVSTLKNTKLDVDLTPSNTTVSKEHDVNNEELVNASEETLKEMVMEMNQTLNLLSGSVTTTDSSTGQAEVIVENDSVSVAGETNDPALLKAISKMKKLDIKLADVTKRERRVKRQRKKLEKLLEDGMEPSSALALVQNETNSDDESLAPSSPVFPTELRDKPVQVQTTKPKETPHESCATTDNLTSKSSDKKNPPRLTQDFIKRNIELVQDAGSLVAMTEEEKKRLEQLLEDGVVEDMEETKEIHHHELAVINETAFVPDETNLERLREIDSRLEAMVPIEDQRNISTPESSEAHYIEFQEALRAFHDEPIEESDQPGEIALMEFKHSRGEQQRLKEIDQRLKHLETCDDDETLPPLSVDQLKELIEQCCREQRITYPSNQSSPVPLDNDEMNNS